MSDKNVLDQVNSTTLLTGSYHAEDCQFLLQLIDIPTISVEEKEKQLQSGAKHYSEMVSHESLPSDL